MPVPFTFRILDERRPMVYAPSVASEPRIHFLRGFPKIGAYQVSWVWVKGVRRGGARSAHLQLRVQGGRQPPFALARTWRGCGQVKGAPQLPARCRVQ